MRSIPVVLRQKQNGIYTETIISHDTTEEIWRPLRSWMFVPTILSGMEGKGSSFRLMEPNVQFLNLGGFGPAYVLHVVTVRINIWSFSNFQMYTFYTLDLPLHACHAVWVMMDSLEENIKMYAAEAQISLLFHAFFFLVKPGDYITHNATWSQTVLPEICVC